MHSHTRAHTNNARRDALRPADGRQRGVRRVAKCLSCPGVHFFIIIILEDNAISAEKMKTNNETFYNNLVWGEMEMAV